MKVNDCSREPDKNIIESPFKKFIVNDLQLRQTIYSGDKYYNLLEICQSI